MCSEIICILYHPDGNYNIIIAIFLYTKIRNQKEVYARSNHSARTHDFTHMAEHQTV